jgi:serine/threonine-protein kinase
MSNILRIPLFFAVFVLLGLVFGYLTFKVLTFSRTVEVPAVVNMTLLQANEALSKAGLYLKIEGEDYDPTVQAGKILRQDVPAGNKVKEKRAIKVVVSKGPRIYSVPSMVGETLEDARDALLQQGLKIGKIIYVHSDSMEKGKIVAQRPEPEERLTDTITALVSLGPYELSYHCPDFVNKGLADAKALAEKMGLAVDIKGEGGTVLSQNPGPGSPVKTGDKLILGTGDTGGMNR